MPLAAVAQSYYGVIDLGTLGGNYSEARGINNQNEVVGMSAKADGKVHGFLWRNGALTDLAVLPGGDFSEAHAINNSGMIAGRGNGSGGMIRGIRWTAAVPEDLGTGVASNSAAYAINAGGLVVGDTSLVVPPFFSFTQNRAVRWTGGTPAIIGPEPAFGTAFSFAYGINTAGKAVGSASYADTGGNPHACIFGATLTDLHNATLGFAKSQARAINDNGTVVGFAWSHPSAILDPEAIVWTASNVMTRLPALSGLPFSAAYGINSSGAAVGYGTGGSPVPVLWASNSIIELQSRIPADSGWNLDIAYGINDAGLMVGVGQHTGQTRGFLLFPTNLFFHLSGSVVVEATDTENKTATNFIAQAPVELSAVILGVPTVLGTKYTDAAGRFDFIALRVPAANYSLKVTLNDQTNRIAIYDWGSDTNNVAWLRSPLFAAQPETKASLRMTINEGPPFTFMVPGATNVPPGLLNTANYYLNNVSFSPGFTTNALPVGGAASNAGRNHFAHLAVIYRNTLIAADFATTRLALAMPRVPVRAYHPGAWIYDPWLTNAAMEVLRFGEWDPPCYFQPAASPFIVLPDLKSAYNEPQMGLPGNPWGWNQVREKLGPLGLPLPDIHRTAGRNRPDNREFHEYSHGIMFASQIAGPNNLPAINGNNHGGVSNPDSQDAWAESFAAFSSMLISDVMLDVSEKADPSVYVYDGVRAPFEGGIYRWDSPIGRDAPLDHNGDGAPGVAGVDDDGDGLADGLDTQVINNRYGRQPPRWDDDEDGLAEEEFQGDEEDFMPSVLWDLYDPGNRPAKPDDDPMHLTLAQLWSILNNAGGPNGADGTPLSDWKAVHDAFIAFANSNPGILNQADVDNRFAQAGYYDDSSGDGRRDAGEIIGQVSWRQFDGQPIQTHRRDRVARAGSTAMLSVTNGLGGEEMDVTFVITEEWPTETNSHTRRVIGPNPKGLAVEVPPGAMRVLITARRPGYNDSDPLTIDVDEFWNAVHPAVATKAELLLEHGFALGAPIAHDVGVTAAVSMSAGSNALHVKMISAIANFGPLGATNVVLTHTLPSGASNVTATAGAAVPVISPSNIVVSMPSLAAGETLVLTAEFDRTPGPMTNRIQVTASGTDANPANNLIVLATKATPPPSVIATLTNGILHLSFATRSDSTYVIEQTDSLDPSIWETVAVLPGNDAGSAFEIPITSAPTSFFRVRID